LWEQPERLYAKQTDRQTDRQTDKQTGSRELCGKSQMPHTVATEIKLLLAAEGSNRLAERLAADFGSGSGREGDRKGVGTALLYSQCQPVKTWV
jgi:hypothetical protein